MSAAERESLERCIQHLREQALRLLDGVDLLQNNDADWTEVVHLLQWVGLELQQRGNVLTVLETLKAISG